MTIAIINYDAGNIRSVIFALERLGVEPILTADPDIIRAAISEHIASRRRDPKFQERLRSRIDRVSQLLDD